MTPYSLADAERDCATALASGDLEAINAAAATLDRLEAESRKSLPSLASAALWYAEQGFRVFPLIPGRKAPTGKCADCKATECPGPASCGHELCHGVLDATSDRETVVRWWTDMPKANIGIATGHQFDCVDIDGPVGLRSRLDHWDDIFAQIHVDCVAKVLTPRPGGMHLWVPPTGDGNSTGILPGVDYRGIGGYVVAPPSVVLPGTKDHPGTYSFLGTPSLAALATTGAA